MAKTSEPNLSKTAPITTHLLPSDKTRAKELARSKGKRVAEWMRDLILKELEREGEVMDTA